MAPLSVLVYTSLFTTTTTVFGGPEDTATLCISKFGMAPWLIVVQVSPPSALCRRPSTSMPTQMLWRSVGSMAMPVTRGVPTAGHSAAASMEVFCQLLPPS